MSKGFDRYPFMGGSRTAVIQPKESFDRYANMRLPVPAAKKTDISTPAPATAPTSGEATPVDFSAITRELIHK